jgi:crossover junction endodeoxyribonuclease RuvC
VSDLRIAGLDLSLTSTGVALIQPGGPVSVHRIQPPAAAKASAHERLKYLYTAVRSLVHGATHITVEGPSYGSNQGQHALGGVWWIVMHVLWLDNPEAEVVVVSPTTLKVYATGRGNKLEKDEVAISVVRRYPDADIRNNDMADAFVLAAMTADQLGCPLTEMPKTHRRALDAWPYTEKPKRKHS